MTYLNFRVLCAVVISLFPLASFAASVAEEKATYCGSGFTEQLVPDEFAGCVLAESCRLHDICYGRCDPEGDLFGSTYCQQSEMSEARRMSKRQCDEKLSASINALNDDRKVCSVIGGFYKLMVGGFGQGPFNGKERLDIYLKAYDATGNEVDAEKQYKAIIALGRRGLIEPERIRVEDQGIILPLNQGIDSPLNRGADTIVLPKNLNDSQIRQLEAAPIQ